MYCHNTLGNQLIASGFFCLQAVIICRFSAGNRHCAGKFSHKNRRAYRSSHENSKAMEMYSAQIKTGITIPVGMLIVRIAAN